ncbi:putative Actin-like protein [Leptomonas pyrrhocoris]|uniref:Putative Actin-like protein n=1 Tax=Leptomonas pyrrhocoris TaxID=157538 RepID=A0A0N0VFM2_LEPPY|nr:putative Actin-like protein [Leptomonas pyrrhocoris]KPA81321.1 putative Actin-like protein [Leptomonas pyrrhocoris]|eukprot:XP_015659760.1 putative Actin-like protein [Leptomonas pyrrhocoris]
MSSSSATMQSVVVDIGSRNTRVGFSGEESPRVVQRSCVGLPRDQRPRPTLLQHRLDVVAGDEAYEDGGLLALTWPIQHGHVCDYEGLEKLLFSAFVDEARVCPEANPFLFLESADQSRRDRERLCELLYESFNMPLVGFLTNTAATLYASGRTSGLAIDSGAGRTCMAAVEEGYTLAHSIRLSSVAGDVLTDELFAALRAEGYPLSTSADRDLVEAAKEALGRVSADVTAEPTQAEDDDFVTPSADDGFVLPDQQRLFLLDHAYKVPEILFDWRLLTYTADQASQASMLPFTPTGYARANPTSEKMLLGWTDMLRDAAGAAPRYLEKTLYENVVLGGGNTLFKGVEQRVQREIVAMAPTGVQASCVAFAERGLAPWIGASIWGCSSVFPSTCLSKAAYHEQGCGAVHLYTQ